MATASSTSFRPSRGAPGGAAFLAVPFSTAPDRITDRTGFSGALGLVLLSAAGVTVVAFVLMLFVQGGPAAHPVRHPCPRR